MKKIFNLLCYALDKCAAPERTDFDRHVLCNQMYALSSILRGKNKKKYMQIFNNACKYATRCGVHTYWDEFDPSWLEDNTTDVTEPFVLFSEI